MYSILEDVDSLGMEKGKCILGKYSNNKFQLKKY
jgi:hypothetical protein